MHFPFTSIRKKLIVIGIISIFLLCSIYVLVSSIFTTNIITDLIYKDSSIYLKFHADRIGDWLEERINEIEIYAGNPIVESMDKEEIYLFLVDEQWKHSQKYMSLMYADSQGNYITSSLKNAGSVADREYFSKVMRGEALLSNPVISKTTAKKVCVVAAPIKGEHGEAIGCIGGVIDLSQFHSFVEEFQTETKYQNTFVVGKSGEVISHSNTYYILNENLTQPSNKVSQELAAKSQSILTQERGNFIIEGSEGRRVVAFQEIPNTDGWKIVSVIPMRAFYKPVDTINMILVLIGLGLVIVGVIGSIILAGKLSKPIIEMKEVFDQAAYGDLRVRANTQYRDEIGKAGKSFNVMMDRINELIYYDSLTGLPNRQSFMHKLNMELRIEETGNHIVGVVIISLNKFKQVNDVYGHIVGDRVLCEIAKRLKGEAKPRDMVARLSGDEFIAYFPQESHREKIVERVERLLRKISEEIPIQDNQIHISTSIGLAFYPSDGQDGETLIKNASIAKSTAKYSEGSTYKIYSPNMQEELKENVSMSSLLHEALENKEFFLVYQPFIGIKERDTVGAEALLRWKHPHRGIISPKVFIPLLEETGLIVPVGEWVLREACRQNKQWQEMGLKPIVISVNVSPIQFEKDNFVGMVKKILKETKLEPRYLQLEITEGIAMHNTDGQLKKLDKLHKMGVKIAIDDFGTGYSSLSYFKKFPIHTLKIDQSFVRDIFEKGNSKAIISTIVSMGNNLGLSTTAEGVETQEQFQYIKQQGCNSVQGYLFSKPIGCQEFQDYLKSTPHTMPENANS